MLRAERAALEAELAALRAEEAAREAEEAAREAERARLVAEIDHLNKVVTEEQPGFPMVNGADGWIPMDLPPDDQE